MILSSKEKEIVKKFLNYAKDRKLLDSTAPPGEPQFYYELDDIAVEPILTLLQNLVDA